MNTDCTFSADNVYEFIKLLVECGGIHYVDKDHVIRYVSDDSPVGVKSGSGAKAPVKSVALYRENMELDSSKTLLNPFSEYVGYHPERDWFYNYMTGLPGCLIKFAMLAIAETVTSDDKDLDVKTAKKLANFSSRIDSKFINELKKVRSCDIGHIMYSKEKHVAQLISALWEPEFEKGALTKMRKSTLLLIRDMVAGLLQVGMPEEIKYQATLVSCPEFDATIHVVVEAVKRIAPIVEPVLSTDLHVKELEEHLQHIEAYHKAVQWLTTSTASPVKDAPTGPTTIADITNPPWGGTTGNPGGTPIMSTPATGMIPNPTPQVTPAAPVVTPVTPEPPQQEGQLTPISSIANARPVLPTFTVPAISMTPQPAMPVMPMMGAPAMGYSMPMMPGMCAPIPSMMPTQATMAQIQTGFNCPSPMANQMVARLPGAW